MPPSRKTKPNHGESAEQSVRLRIVCKAPPDPEQHGATFGLQDNSSTANWVLHPGKRKPNGDLQFECEVRVRPNARTGEPNFLGDFAHGPSEKRFLYLCVVPVLLGAYFLHDANPGATWTWFISVPVVVGAFVLGLRWEWRAST